jgi:hypothetical protein
MLENHDIKPCSSGTKQLSQNSTRQVCQTRINAEALDIPKVFNVKKT